MSLTDSTEPQIPPKGERPRSFDKLNSLSQEQQFWIPGLSHVRKVIDGGQAQVFCALDEEKRRVAVKVLRSSASHDRSLQRRLRKEAELLRSFDHPCILPLYREGVLSDGRPYLISPWINGTSLRDLPTSLTAGQVAGFFADVLDAVGHAHRARVLHRDLHPRNLFMTESFRACVLDFGVAKITGRGAAENETRDGVLLGVQRYSAPEVLRFGSKHATAASDVYSLGLVMREFASRFEGLGLPGELDRLLRFCCADSRAGRYRDADELAMAFHMWRNRMPVPRPHKRGVSRRSLMVAAPLLLVSMVVFLNFDAPSRLRTTSFEVPTVSLVDRVLPVLAASDVADYQQRLALLEVCEAVEALRAPYNTLDELEATNLRRAACDRVAAQLASLDRLPDETRELRELLRFYVGLAELDAVFEWTQGDGDENLFRLGSISNQELGVLRDQRDQPLARLQEGHRGIRLGSTLEFLRLMQEARLPRSDRTENGVRALIGWTSPEAARFSNLLDQMKADDAPSEWIALGSARRSLSRLASAVGGRQAAFSVEVQAQAQQIEDWLQEFPNQQAFEVRHMRAELAEVMGN